MLRMLAAFVASLVTSAPALAAETIATLPNESFIRSLGDRHLVQIRGETGYRLATIKAGEVRPIDAIEPSRDPFEADLGTMPGGEPAVVFSRCRGQCDLYLHELAGAGVRKLRGANTRADESAPTLWRGRLAWVRDRRVAMTLRIGSRARSRRLFRAPRGEYSAIEELELRGRHLGIDLVYPLPRGIEEAARRVQLLDLRNGRRRTVGRADGGSTGHRLRGVSFSGGWLGWHDSFWETEDEFVGRAHRMNLRTGVQQFARIGNFAGFTLRGSGFLTVSGGERLDVDECDPDPGCAVQRENRVVWRRGNG